MNENINLLRDKLEKQIVTERPYKEIYETSVNLDKLLVLYYKKRINFDQTA